MNKTATKCLWTRCDVGHSQFRNKTEGNNIRGEENKTNEIETKNFINQKTKHVQWKRKENKVELSTYMI